jgi:hypothetical protein
MMKPEAFIAKIISRRKAKTVPIPTNINSIPCASIPSPEASTAHRRGASITTGGGLWEEKLVTPSKRSWRAS